MIPQEPIRDIMRRSMANLEFIERHATVAGPFKTTQLLNTFLGALAHPWEMFRDHDALRVDLAAAEADGWPSIRKQLPSDRDPRNLNDLVRMLRNGIAHGNIEFLPAGDGTIGALKIWNCPPRQRRDWGAIISVRDMRALLTKFHLLAERLCEEHALARPIVA